MSFRVFRPGSLAHEAVRGRTAARFDAVVTPLPDGGPADVEMLADGVEGPARLEQPQSLQADGGRVHDPSLAGGTDDGDSEDVGLWKALWCKGKVPRVGFEPTLYGV